jgi:hypothetical protein
MPFNLHDLPVTVLLVALDLAVSEKLHPTLQTLLNFNVEMSLLMNFSVAIRDKAFVAVITFVLLFTCVDFDVRYQAVLELELLAADFVWALVAIVLAEELKIVHTLFVWYLLQILATFVKLFLLFSFIWSVYPMVLFESFLHLVQLDISISVIIEILSPFGSVDCSTILRGLFVADFLEITRPFVLEEVGLFLTWVTWNGLLIILEGDFKLNLTQMILFLHLFDLNGLRGLMAIGLEFAGDGFI